jgi:hypothetical protein
MWRILPTVLGLLSIAIAAFLFIQGTGIHNFIRPSPGLSASRKKFLRVFGVVAGIVLGSLGIVIVLIATLGKTS